jgi:transcription elongation factor Elf1
MANNINDYEISGAFLKSKVSTEKYKDGWDRIFGTLSCNHCDMIQDNKDNVLCQSCGKEITKGRS